MTLCNIPLTWKKKKIFKDSPFDLLNPPLIDRVLDAKIFGRSCHWQGSGPRLEGSYRPAATYVSRASNMHADQQYIYHVSKQFRGDHFSRVAVDFGSRGFRLPRSRGGKNDAGVIGRRPKTKRTSPSRRPST